MSDLFLEAKQIIDQDDIKIVSFDLFDTLLFRPCMSGNDLLRLFSATVEKEYNIDITNLRLSAEKMLKNPHASTREIWHYIAEQKGITLELAEVLVEKEFNFQLNFLFPRCLVKDIFNYAVQKGKKVIVVSDMYFTSEQIRKILDVNGYSGVSAVYVSCEQGATKRTGDLFDVVLLKENIQTPTDVFHIGDSRKADVIAPQAKGITVLHIPRDISEFKERFATSPLLDDFGDYLYENIVYGFSIHRLIESSEKYSDNLPLITYAHLVMFPMLLHVALYLLFDPQIQKSNTYRKLYFASRDGFLTKKAYDILSTYVAECLESDYLLISRITAATLTEDNFFDRMDASFIPENCTLRDFIVPTVTNDELRDQLLSELSEEQLSLSVCRDREFCMKLLSNYKEVLDQHHQEKKNAAYLYYSKAFANATSVLIADCGFSGTISNYLSKGFNSRIKFDKAFFWENQKNKQLDCINKTKTYTAFSQKKGHALGPMVESLFSEVSGSCIGFNCKKNGDIEPVFEELWQPNKMKEDISLIQEISIELVKGFADVYGSYLPLIVDSSLQTVMAFVLMFFAEENIEELSMFNNIRFKETYLHDMNSESLGDMMLHRNSRGDCKENG